VTVKSFCILFLLTVLPVVSAQAQAVKPPLPQSVAAVDPDMQKRIELATRMADLTPPRDTVVLAVNTITSSAPPDQRQEVKSKMLSAFDFDGFRQTVIQDMAKTFTVPELQKMVDYHSSPEAKSIAQKMPAYENMIQPEMTRLLDVALMVARTGAAPSSSKPAP
jgi:hypothetical protein